jgi:hypothetical protein
MDFKAPEKRKTQRRIPKLSIKVSSDTWATPELKTPRLKLQDAQQRIDAKRLEMLRAQD